MAQPFTARPGYRNPLEDGRRRNRTLTVWVADDQLARIDRVAELNGLSRAHLVSKAINYGLKELRKSGALK